MNTLTEAFEELNKLNEDETVKPKTSDSLKCPYCGSAATHFVNVTQEANPDKNGAGGVGTHYAELNHYVCEACACKFYSFKEVIVRRGIEVEQEGVRDNEECSITLDTAADSYEQASKFYANEGYRLSDLKADYGDEFSEDILEDDYYEVGGLWYEGKKPDVLGMYLSEEDFITLSNKMHELNIDCVHKGYDHRGHNAYGKMRGSYKNIKQFISWCKEVAFDPFYDNPEDWRLDNDNEEYSEFDFSILR